VTHSVVQILGRGNAAELARADRTDGQLLDLFVHKRDEEAFAMVVRRHGPMVLSVCRRILRNPADADDAFQAAFLVLARKASSLGSRELLAPWLYGVAFNAARKLRHSNARRAEREKPLVELPDQGASVAWDSRGELIAILDEELSRLPERYRLPLVLCDLEGNTRREAAVLLGCPEGTVAGRLARARAMLADRLTRRGIALGGALLAAVLTERTVCAAAQISELLRAMQGPISPRIADVTERVLTAMFARKILGIVVAVLVCGLVCAGIAGTFHLTANADPGSAPPEVKDEKTPAKSAPDAKPGAKKVFTAFPLKKADAALTAGLVTEHFKNKPGITISWYEGDNTLLVYADEKTTGEVEALLKKLGEEPRRKPTVLLLNKGTKPTDAAKSLVEIFGDKSRAWIEPAPGENALLVYATEIDTLIIRRLLGVAAAPSGEEPAKPLPEQKMYTFGFRNTPWADVLAWYAAESGLTDATTEKPTGNVTIMPPKDRKFTFGEITDLINESLMAQKRVLLRRQATFIVVPADEKIDSTLIPRIELSELPNRGKTELVQVLILLKELDAKDTAPEVQRLLSPFGSISAFAKTNTLLVMDTVGSIQRIAKTIEDIEAAAKKDPRKEELEFRRYSVPPGTAEALAKTPLSADPKLRLITLPASNEILLFARPKDHDAFAARLKNITEETKK
jgi:RNA polymerase sigma factor (sigma-70 family)